MLNHGARTLLFLGSYAPVSVIFAVIYWGRQPIVVGVSIGAMFLGVLGSEWILFAAARHTEPWPVRVMECRLRGDEVMGYIAAYLIPLFGLNLADWRQCVAILMLLAILWYLYVTTDMLYINPTLHLMGCRVYDATLEGSGTFRLIGRPGLTPGELIQVVNLDAGLRERSQFE